MSEQQQIMTPTEFESQLMNSTIQSSNPESESEPTKEPEEPSSEPEKQEEPPETSVADKEALGGEEEPETQDAKSESEEPAEKEEKKDEQVATDTYTKDTLHEVKVDGVKEQVKLEQALKSYERFRASTQRFQEASEIKKEAKAIKAEAEKSKVDLRNSINIVMSNPKEMLDFVMHSPQVAHQMFEMYAKQHVSDQELREKDPNLYNATLEQRRREDDIKRQQQEIARQRREIEAANTRNNQERENQSVQKTLEVYERSATESLKAEGLPDDIAKSRMVRESFRSYVQSAWTDGLLLSDLPNLVSDCAKEFVKDPVIKNMIGTSKSEPKKEDPKAKPKATVTVTSPEPGPSKNKFMTPNEFLKNIVGH